VAGSIKEAPVDALGEALAALLTTIRHLFPQYGVDAHTNIAIFIIGVVIIAIAVCTVKAVSKWLVSKD
jgi:hypothetical protein